MHPLCVLCVFGAELVLTPGKLVRVRACMRAWGALGGQALGADSRQAGERASVRVCKDAYTVMLSIVSS